MLSIHAFEPYVLGANMDMIDLSDQGKLVSTGPAIDSRECLGAVVSNGRIFYASQASGFVVSQTFGQGTRGIATHLGAASITTEVISKVKNPSIDFVVFRQPQKSRRIESRSSRYMRTKRDSHKFLRSNQALALRVIVPRSSIIRARMDPVPLTIVGKLANVMEVMV